MKLTQHRIRQFEGARKLIGSGVCAALLATGCSPESKDLLQAFIDSLAGHGSGGGPNDPPPASGCEVSDFDNLFELLNQDLSGLDTDDRVFTRYLSLANRANAAGCGSQLDTDRAAMTKLLNSLSTAPTVQEPLAVDAELTLYRIDLRDYDWDRPIEVSGTTFSDAWEAVAASNTYAVPFVGDDADDAVADTGTTVPVMFSDSLLAASAVGDLYYALVDVPEDLDAFIANDLGVDVADDLVIRVGFSGENIGVSGHAFLAERRDLQVRAGYLWQISDFGGGPNGLFQDPFGDPEGDRELIFTLPNGMLGFALATADGERLNDSDLLLDFSQSNFAYSIAVSAFSKYAGGVEVVDEVREFALANLNLSRAEKARLRELYPNAGQLASIVSRDRESYQDALARAKLDIGDPEPVSATFSTFDADVDLATAAGDLLVSPEFLQQNLRELDPAVQVLGDGRTLDRGDWTDRYVRSLCTFTIVLENAPESATCDAAFSDL